MFAALAAPATFINCVGFQPVSFSVWAFRPLGLWSFYEFEQLVIGSRSKLADLPIDALLSGLFIHSLPSAISFPLNRSRWLRSDIEDHAVDAFDFVHDAVGNFLKHIVGELRPVGGHAIFRMHGADGAGVSVSALVAHHAHGHYRQQHRE